MINKNTINTINDDKIINTTNIFKQCKNNLVALSSSIDKYINQERKYQQDIFTEREKIQILQLITNNIPSFSVITGRTTDRGKSAYNREYLRSEQFLLLCKKKELVRKILAIENHPDIKKIYANILGISENSIHSSLGSIIRYAMKEYCHIPEYLKLGTENQNSSLNHQEDYIDNYIQYSCPALAYLAFHLNVEITENHQPYRHCTSLASQLKNIKKEIFTNISLDALCKLTTVPGFHIEEMMKQCFSWITNNHDHYKKGRYYYQNFFLNEIKNSSNEVKNSSNEIEFSKDFIQFCNHFIKNDNFNCTEIIALHPYNSINDLVNDWMKIICREDFAHFIADPAHIIALILSDYPKFTFKDNQGTEYRLFDILLEICKKIDSNSNEAIFLSCILSIVEKRIEEAKKFANKIENNLEQASNQNNELKLTQGPIQKKNPNWLFDYFIQSTICNNQMKSIDNIFKRENIITLDNVDYEIDKFFLAIDMSSINLSQITLDKITKYIKKNNLINNSELANYNCEDLAVNFWSDNEKYLIFQKILRGDNTHGLNKSELILYMLLIAVLNNKINKNMSSDDLNLHRYENKYARTQKILDSQPSIVRQRGFQSYTILSNGMINFKNTYGTSQVTIRSNNIRGINIMNKSKHTPEREYLTRPQYIHYTVINKNENEIELVGSEVCSPDFEYIFSSYDDHFYQMGLKANNHKILYTSINNIHGIQESKINYVKEFNDNEDLDYIFIVDCNDRDNKQSYYRLDRGNLQPVQLHKKLESKEDGLIKPMNAKVNENHYREIECPNLIEYLDTYQEDKTKANEISKHFPNSNYCKKQKRVENTVNFVSNIKPCNTAEFLEKIRELLSNHNLEDHKKEHIKMYFNIFLENIYKSDSDQQDDFIMKFNKFIKDDVDHLDANDNPIYFNLLDDIMLYFPFNRIKMLCGDFFEIIKNSKKISFSKLDEFKNLTNGLANYLLNQDIDKFFIEINYLAQYKDIKFIDICFNKFLENNLNETNQYYFAKQFNQFIINNKIIIPPDIIVKIMSNINEDLFKCILTETEYKGDYTYFSKLMKIFSDNNGFHEIESYLSILNKYISDFFENNIISSKKKNNFIKSLFFLMENNKKYFHKEEIPMELEEILIKYVNHSLGTTGEDFNNFYENIKEIPKFYSKNNNPLTPILKISIGQIMPQNLSKGLDINLLLNLIENISKNISQPIKPIIKLMDTLVRNKISIYIKNEKNHVYLNSLFLRMKRNEDMIIQEKYQRFIKRFMISLNKSDEQGEIRKKWDKFKEEYINFIVDHNGKYKIKINTNNSEYKENNNGNKDKIKINTNTIEYKENNNGNEDKIKDDNKLKLLSKINSRLKEHFKIDYENIKTIKHIKKFVTENKYKYINKSFKNTFKLKYSNKNFQKIYALLLCKLILDTNNPTLEKSILNSFISTCYRLSCISNKNSTAWEYYLADYENAIPRKKKDKDKDKDNNSLIKKEEAINILYKSIKYSFSMVSLSFWKKSVTKKILKDSMNLIGNRSNSLKNN